MLSALIAALINPIEIIGTKKIFGKEKINYKAFLVLNMFFILIFSSVAYIIWGEIDFTKITIFVIILFGFELIVSFFLNVLFYYSLSGDRVSRVQPIAMMVPITSVALAAIFYPDERNWPIFMITLIAASALAYSRIEKHHLVLNKYSVAMLGFVFLMSVESLLAKYILEVFSPVAFYTIRIGILTFFLSLFLRPNLKNFGKKRLRSVFLLSFLITAEMIAWYIAISQIGIVKTSLIFLLGPVLTLLASKFHLKEKITLKAALSDAVIVICIAASILVGS